MLRTVGRQFRRYSYLLGLKLHQFQNLDDILFINKGALAEQVCPSNKIAQPPLLRPNLPSLIDIPSVAPPLFVLHQ